MKDPYELTYFVHCTSDQKVKVKLDAPRLTADTIQALTSKLIALFLIVGYSQIIF